MPAYDRTGPRGLGSMTGRGMGQCGRFARSRVPFQEGDSPRPQNFRNRMNWDENDFYGCGYGYGRGYGGYGRGMGRRFFYRGGQM